VTDKLIDFALKQRLAVIALFVMLIVAGLVSFSMLPMDSFPDVSNVQVQIITEPESMATEEVESIITIPIENAMAGLPGKQIIRSNSSFGMSVVTVIFEDSMNVYLARQLVQQRLNTLVFPKGVPMPQLGPVVSSFSNVFMYYLEGPQSEIDLRTTQDWVVARKIRSVPGVGNVVSYGGFVKQYQVLLNPDRMKAYDVTLKEVVDAVEANNSNAGGNFVEQGGEEIIIRGLGRINAVSDIENIVLREYGGTPVKLGQLATVTINGAFRRGSASMNGHGEAITGIVLTRKGVNTKEVVGAVEKCIESMHSQLPEGVKIHTYYNQMELVDKTMDTVKEILLFSGALVVVILAAILLNIRAAIIAAVIIPLSLLFSFLMMKFTGLSSNLMTLGAVDFGVIVDAGVVMVENVFRHLAEEQHGGKVLSPPERLRVVIRAAREVGKPILFSILIIIAVYIPLFTLEGVEGKMFQPLALTFIYSISGALICSLTIIPLLCYFVLNGKVEDKESPILKYPRKTYANLLDGALARPKLVVISAVAGLIFSLTLIPFLGSEFIPTLDEGSILLRTKLAPSVSHTQSIEIAQIIESVIKEFPEVTCVVSRIGRSGMGSDLDGVDNADTYIGLKPKSEWRIKDKEQLVGQMAKKLDAVPGLVYSFSQPIADMVDDLVSGVKADLAIKVFGNDLHEIDRISASILEAIRNVPGCADLQRERMLGSPQLNIRLNRSNLARYGLNVQTVQQYVQTALAGSVVTEVFEDNKRFGVCVRLPRKERDSVEDIGNLLVSSPSGATIPLKMLADITLEPGTVMVNREEAQRRTAVLCNIRGRDLGGFVQEAQAKVARDVKLPKDVRIVWGGQFENQQRAMARLAVVVPIVLLLIFILLFAAFNSFKNACLVMANVPFAVIGGIVGLFVSHLPISVPAIIGFIALFGVAVQNGVILVTYISQLNKKMSVVDAIREGATVRFRPVLMTALVAIMGLLPKIFSQGTGSEVQRPLATVVLGGLVSATLLTLMVLPVMYKLTTKDGDEEPEPSEPSVADEGTGLHVQTPDSLPYSHTYVSSGHPEK
jgi:cobalt-zinc-cadmium resistance protein CzcA